MHVQVQTLPGAEGTPWSYGHGEDGEGCGGRSALCLSERWEVRKFKEGEGTKGSCCRRAAPGEREKGLTAGLSRSRACRVNE